MGRTRCDQFLVVSGARHRRCMLAIDEEIRRDARRRAEGLTVSVIGLGCMRLATAADDGVAEAVIVAAIDAGVSLLDTADAYARGDGDIGRGERQCARARAARPATAVRVVTKGGLTRPGGAWVADGRASSLAAA